MKARHLFFLAILFFILGIIIPYGLYFHDIQAAEDWNGIFWIIIAPAVYANIAIPLWIIGFIFLIIGLVEVKNG